jgi:hypothetical protein
VAAPSAENRLAAKMPTMPGFFCSAASVTCAAMDALSWSNCVPDVRELGVSLACVGEALLALVGGADAGLAR